MRRASSPRPWTIRTFAVLLVSAALWNFVPQLLAALDEPDQYYRIALVSTLSAQLLIVAIPVAAIWFFASNIARWLFTALSIWSAARLIAHTADMNVVTLSDGWWLAAGLATHCAFLLLFAPSARAWFARTKTGNAEAFA